MEITDKHTLPDGKLILTKVKICVGHCDSCGHCEIEDQIMEDYNLFVRRYCSNDDCKNSYDRKYA